MNKIPFEWERIYNHHSAGVGGTNTHRAKTIGGWIVSVETYTNGVTDGLGRLVVPRNITQSMTFIPDPNHEWEVEI